MLSGVKGGRSESTNRQDLEDFVSGAHNYVHHIDSVDIKILLYFYTSTSLFSNHSSSDSTNKVCYLSRTSRMFTPSTYGSIHKGFCTEEVRVSIKN
jgi:hypothetical protein